MTQGNEDLQFSGITGVDERDGVEHFQVFWRDVSDSPRIGVSGEVAVPELRTHLKALGASDDAIHKHIDEVRAHFGRR